MITTDPLLGWLLVMCYLPAGCVVFAVVRKVWLSIRRARLNAMLSMPGYRGKRHHYSRWYAETLRSSGGRTRL